MKEERRNCLLKTTKCFWLGFQRFQLEGRSTPSSVYEQDVNPFSLRSYYYYYPARTLFRRRYNLKQYSGTKNQLTRETLYHEEYHSENKYRRNTFARWRRFESVWKPCA
eukprot:701732-Rhodomonas_salina.1